MLNFNKKLFLSLLLWRFFFSSLAQARTSLGIGINEDALAQPGFSSEFFLKIYKLQLYFEQLMSKALLSFNASPHAALWLIGLAFLYGMLHSIGPGHGKVVISSYLLANNTTLKRGLLIAFCAAMLQSFTAITIIGAVFFFLPVSWTSAAFWVTNISFAFIIGLGLYMLYRSSCRLKASFCATNINSNSTEAKACSCGHSHIADAKTLEGAFNWKTALYAIFAIGLRPCSGALLIMSFAMIQHMYFPGCLAIMAMGLGTFTTISFLAFCAIHVKKFANLYLTRAGKANKILIMLEWLFALLIFLMGLFLALTAFFKV